MADAAEAAPTKGFLGWVERTGNKLPDPVFLFAYFILAFGMFGYILGYFPVAHLCLLILRTIKYGHI